MAHEVRNPLAVLKMLYHSLDLRYPPEDPRARDAEIMGQKMDQLNRIVERILDFARGAEPRLAPVDLNGLINDLALLTRHKLKHQGVELERRLAPDLPPMTADATQLEQAFLNLTLNAAEAMPEGGRLIIVTRLLRLPRHPGAPSHVVIEFHDTGQGMSDEVRKRTLERLLLTTTKQGGTGLGLAIVRRIVEVHRGQLKIKSKAGQGTSITLTFPLQAADAGAEKAAAGPQPAETQASLSP